MKQVLYSLAVTIIYNSLKFLPLVNAVADDNLALLSSDIIAPEFKHPPALNGIAPNDISIIRATVTDNVDFNFVTLFNREIHTRTEFNRIEKRPDFILGGITYA